MLRSYFIVVLSLSLSPSTPCVFVAGVGPPYNLRNNPGGAAPAHVLPGAASCSSSTARYTASEGYGRSYGLYPSSLAATTAAESSQYREALRLKAERDLRRATLASNRKLRVLQRPAS